MRASNASIFVFSCSDSSSICSGKAADRTPVSEVMSAHVHWCYEDQPIDEVLDEMSDTQIRRLPVVDREKHLVGIVSLGDLATHAASD
jgi:CBS domain-containing protein